MLFCYNIKAEIKLVTKMEKLDSKNTNLHMKTCSAETVATLTTDNSALVLSKPRKVAGKRYIDKSYLRKIHLVE